MTKLGQQPQSMPFGNVLRGRVAERILVTLLERGGYRVTRLGIEEIFDEIKLLGVEQYLSLKLPIALRSLPDLLVADPEVTWAVLLEIKFRRSFDRLVAQELHATLSEQRKYWPDSYAVVMIGNPFVKGGRFHQDYIRLIMPDETDKLLWTPSSFEGETERKRMHCVWDSLWTLAKLFKMDHVDTSNEPGRSKSNDFFSSMDYITSTLRDLGCG